MLDLVIGKSAILKFRKPLLVGNHFVVKKSVYMISAEEVTDILYNLNHKFEKEIFRGYELHDKFYDFYYDNFENFFKTWEHIFLMQDRNANYQTYFFYKIRKAWAKKFYQKIIEDRNCEFTKIARNYLLGI